MEEDAKSVYMAGKTVKLMKNPPSNLKNLTD
jgi:hypothetical protein